MFQLPDEEPRLTAIRTTLAADFNFADELCQAWYEVPWDDWFRRLPGDVARVGIRLNAQAFRQFRSVIAECRRAEAFCAGIICRGLFETTVAIAFVLVPEMPLAIEPILDKQNQPKTTDAGVPKNKVSKVYPPSTANLSCEFRAQLYQAHDAFSAYRYFQAMAKVPGIGPDYTRTDDDSMLGITGQLKEAHERIVGPEWAWVLREAGTYSGLSFAETTALVCDHLGDVRNTAYKLLCQDAHAAGAMKHSDWFSSADEVHGTLRLSFMLALRGLDFLQKYLPMDGSHAIRLDQWTARLLDDQ